MSDKIKKKRKRNLYGVFMRPSFMTIEECVNGWSKANAFVSEKFEEAYMQVLHDQYAVIMSAKIYAQANWSKVTDWSGLALDITDNTGETTTYFTYKERPKPKAAEGKKRRSDVIDRIFDEMDAEDKANQNPIVSLTNVVLDPSDGDFSLTINGRNHLWIDGESVIALAGYIEKTLNDENKDDSKT